MDITMEKLESLLTVSEVAELHGVPNRIVRKAGKAGEIPGMVNVLDRMGFDPDLVVNWTPPVVGERKVKREDGRRRFTVYLNNEEVTALTGQGFEVEDPRNAAKARRTARKAAKAEASAAGSADAANDPFADFS